MRQDIRCRYRALMDDSHFRFPKATGKSHAMEWYFDGHLAKRPLIGIYAFANLAEYMLHQAKCGPRRRSPSALREVAEFFAETRRAMQNVLSSYPIGRGLPAAGRRSLAARVIVLEEMARMTYDTLHRTGRRCEKCTACRGKLLTAEDAALLKAILEEQSDNGTIPPESALYRGGLSLTTVI